MKITDVKYDCKHFVGSIPCAPSKRLGVNCTSCTEYKKISNRILIIKLGALGDVIRTTPLLVRLKQQYPDAHFTWLTMSPEVLPKNEIDVIYKLDAASMYVVSNSTYDIAINLDKDTEACILLEKLNATEKYGYTIGDGRIAPATPAAEHKLMTGFFDELSKENTQSYLQEIFEICHLTFNYEPYLINLDSDLSNDWAEKFKILSGGKRLIGLNTGCGPRWNTRLWSDDSWVELADLCKKKGYFPLFIGGELEHEKNKRLSETANVHYPGHFSLKEFISLTNNLELVVTQVSMMMHIATALRKKMVLMNNIFNKHEFELYGRGELIEPEFNCECYYGNSCKHGRSCMQFLRPISVFEKITKLLEE